MLLSSEDIRRHLKSTDMATQLKIDPLDDKDIQPASIDLHLGEKILLASPDWEGWHEFNLKEGPLYIGRQHFVLAHTLEWIGIPATLAGEMIGKSSRAREGWIVEAAGYFDPGWQGRGTLELSLRWPGERVLTYGMAICQMRFHTLTSRPQKLYGESDLGSHYFASDSVEPSYLDRSVPTPGAVVQPVS
jgi:dCTP deaminase